MATAATEGKVEGLGHRQHEEVPEESERSGNQVQQDRRRRPVWGDGARH